MPRMARRSALSGWYALLVVMLLAITIGPWLAGPAGSSAAQAPTDLFTVDVSKTTDLVSGETVEVNVRTVEGTVLYAGAPSQVFTCGLADSYTEADFTDGTCAILGAHLQEADGSLDGDRFHRFSDEGPEHGRRGIAILRPGVGTANWRLGGVDYSLTCGPANPCRLVFRLRLQTGSSAPVDVIQPGPELNYRPIEGVVACEAPTPEVISSTVPDRLQEAWLAWTRDACQSNAGTPPTSAFFQPEGDGLGAFAAGEYDLTYSAVGYRPGFAPETERPMVPVPIGLNAVVLGVGGGYTVDDGSWPQDLPKPHTEFRLTNQHAAILFGQSQFSLVFSDHANEMMANNPQIPASSYLFNSNVSAPVALTGAQSTTLFATNQFDTLAPGDWKDLAGADRGVEVDFNESQPVHDSSFLSLKTGRPDLARLVYRELYSQGTFYVLTDLATASALGLTVVTLPNAAGDWVTPTPETLAAAVPHLLRQEDGTLLPNPQAPAGYPLTFVEYAMAPAHPLVDAACAPRGGSQDLLEGWLEYMTTEGQTRLGSEGGGLVPLTAELRDAAVTARSQVGATPNACTPDPPPTTPPPPGTNGPSASPLGPGGGGFESGSSFGNGPGGSDGAAGPTREATTESMEEALEAAEEDDVELPDLLGIKAIDDLLPPLALLLIVALTTGVAVATAGYPVPARLKGLPRQAWSRRPRRRRSAVRMAGESSGA